MNQFLLLLALLASAAPGRQKESSRHEQRFPRAAQTAPGRKARGVEASGDVVGFNDADEVRLGAALAAQYKRKRGVGPTVESRQIESYLQAVADRLAAHAARRLPYRIHYDPHPAFKSAFALPGGHIIFGGGILALMNTEDELAAVIGHEIIHVDGRQVSDRVARIAKERNISPADLNRWKMEDFGPGYTKQQELACDSEGTRLAVKAGYSPLGMLHLLQTFQLLAGPEAGENPNKATLADRIAQVREEIRAEGWEGLTKERPLELP